MKLYELFQNIQKLNIADREIKSITDNTKKIERDCLFVCVKGNKFDGHDFARSAIELGAAIVVSEKDLGIENQIIVNDTRECYGQICSAWFGYPEQKMNIIGVTGTNGKTTTVNLIKYILTQLGNKVGLIGTIQNEIGDEVLHTENTTPFTYEYFELLNKMYNADCKYVVMEVSSFGLVQKRIGPTKFKVSVFTNLTQDHLDYHKDMEDYFLAKKILFDKSDLAICNIDDDYGVRLYDELKINKISYSNCKIADYYATNVNLNANGTEFELNEKDQKYDVNIKMTGMFNVSNSIAAISTVSNLDYKVEDIIDIISKYNGVKGRCEIIPTNKDFTVICDYAHTPDAIENILKNVKEYTKGNLICLFGCGGNRDKTKRPLMAKAAAKYANMLFITSDNPRDEDPSLIIEDILEGIKDDNVSFKVIVDRKEAIFHALKNALKDDIIVLAGKGHEDYQILANNVHIHFDEREIVKEVLKLI
jgi:UDP-N-acetylmuramoyl-L-alanyl-D-glutamate--2,6-diaminopimelate ligase